MIRVATGLRFRQPVFALMAAISAVILPSPAIAAPEPSAKLVRCGAENCLRVSGYRENAATTVMVNGYVVPVEGARKWAVNLPLDTVREWSAPRARTIEVSLQEPDAVEAQNAKVRLPIGLLGDVTLLASLVISAG